LYPTRRAFRGGRRPRGCGHRVPNLASRFLPLRLAGF
jgi:hypothetical protein